MKSRLKVVGLILVAVLAIGAVGAAGAQGAQPKLTAATGTYPVTLDGEQVGTNEIVIGTKTWKCVEASYSGSLAGESSEVEVTPGWANCHTVIIGTTFDVTVTMNGCTFKFTSDATTNTEEAKYPQTTHIFCPAGQMIELHFYKGSLPGTPHTDANEICHYNISAQTTTGNKVQMTNTNKGTGTADVDLDWNGAQIAYTRTLGTALACGGSSGTASIIGIITFKGTRPAGTVAPIHIN